MPGEDRRVHVTPVPRLGGIAMYSAFAVGVMLTFVFRRYAPTNWATSGQTGRVLFLLVAAGIITAVMAVSEDIPQLKLLPRLLWQVGVALLVVLPSILIPGSSNPGDLPALSTMTRGQASLRLPIQNPFAPPDSLTPFYRNPPHPGRAPHYLLACRYH